MPNNNETLIINPYIAGSPVKDTAMFFGREDVYAWLRQHLRGAYQHNAIVLYGERRSGKTSVLYQMKDKLGDPLYIPVLLDLQGMGLEGIDGFLWEVARKVVLALRGVDGVPALERPVRQHFEKNPRQQFEDFFLPPVLATLGERSLLLMFDEANRLAEKVESRELPPDIFDYLRALIQQTSRVNFIFSLGNRIEANSRGSSQLFNLAVYRKISFLEQDFAEDLITRPVANYYSYTRPAIDRVYQLTSGQAYYTQLLCHNLFTRWAKDKPNQLGVADIDAVIPDVIEQGTPNFQFVWEDSSPAERAILAALADSIPHYKAGVMRRNLDRALHRAKLYPSNGDVTAGLRQLFERDVVNDQEPYNFKVALMRQWIGTFRRLEWVREELGPVAKEWDRLEALRRANAPTTREKARRWAAPVLGVVVMALIIFIYWLSQSSTARVEAARAKGETAAAQFAATQSAFNEALAQQRAELDAASTRIAEAEASGNSLQAELARATATARAAEVEQLQAENTRVAVEAATAVAAAALPVATDTVPPSNTPLPTATPTPLPTDTPTPVPTATPTSPPTATPRPALSASLSGTIAYGAFEGETYNLYYGDVAVGSSQLIRQGASQPAFSPDGSRIAFVSWAGGPGRGLVTANRTGGREILVSPAPEDKLPTWSPDGDIILFFTQRTGDRASQMFLTNANSSWRTEDQQFRGDGEYPSWSTSGQIVYRAKGRNGVGLRIVSASFDNQLSLTDRDEDTAPALSPNGQTVAFMSRRDGNWEIYTINADGTNLTRLTDDPMMDGLPAWSPDGRAIAFVSNSDGEWAIWAITPNGNERSKILVMRNSPNGSVLLDRSNSNGWTEERISWTP